MASALDSPAERYLPDLPAEALLAIARAALHADDDDARTWARLSLVNKTWHAKLQGVDLGCFRRPQIGLRNTHGRLPGVFVPVHKAGVQTGVN
jgi:hypothetical protein